MVEVLLQKLNTSNEPIITYVADNLTQFNLDLNTPVSPYPIPQKNADEQILVKIMGNSAQIQFSWILHTGEDISSTLGSFALGLKKFTCSGGTAPVSSEIGRKVTDDGVVIGYLMSAGNPWLVATNKTPAAGSIMSVVGGTGSQTLSSSVDTKIIDNFLTPNEQVTFFKEVFQPVEVADKFRIHINDVGATPIVADGFYHTQSFSISADQPITWNGNVVFLIGDNIVAFEADSPSQPQNLSLSSGPGQFSASWTAPSSSGGSSLSDYRVYYKKQTETMWGYQNVGSTATSKTITGLESGKFYQVKVAGINGSGVGRNSAIQEVKTT